MKDDTGKPLFNNPFAALKGEVKDVGGVSLPERKKAPEPARASAPPPAKKRPRPGGAVIRLERTGRGGKEVTVIERVGASAADREKLLKRLKGALGCGGTIEGDSLVLQGDQRERLESPAVADLLLLRGPRI
jgi:translation initiation factor 1